ncbi:hypothetical protein [Arachidicoccus sp.]|jgi:hypothetical protein|uniref:hypothetical protein n=1 Tax=Arachidicoccus sp. TaxID=1872624 RepID=UPI003D2216FE
MPYAQHSPAFSTPSILSSLLFNRSAIVSIIGMIKMDKIKENTGNPGTIKDDKFGLLV